MHRTTKLVALSALLISGVAVGCNNDDDDNLPPGEGGSISSTGGSAGAGGATSTTGGTSGTTGASGKSGATGTAGTTAHAGMSGVGGATTAGTGGTPAAGAGGNAGDTQAGAGGVAGESAGGVAGQAGSGGTPAAGTNGGGAGGATAGSGGSAGGSTGPVLTGTPDDMAAIMGKLAMACTDDITTIYTDGTAPTPWAATNRGQVVHCAFDRLVPQAELSKHYSDIGAPDPGIQTDVFKFRISYWVERDSTVTEAMNTGGAAGATDTGVTHGVLTTATLYIPALRAAGNSAASPLIVFAHGSVGSADICAPSKEDPSGYQVDWQTAAYELIGHGWITVMPDYPGLGTPGAASWSYSKDEGRSLLDATRAVRSIAMSSLIGTTNTLIGHSQGGHAVLSAQSYAKDYGSNGTIDAAITYAPLFFSMGSWGAEMSSLAVSLKDFTPDIFSYATQYIYGHLAAHLGESHATDAFLPAQADAAKNMLETMCLDQLADPTTGLWSLTSVPGGGGGSAGAANAAAELYPTEYTSNAGVAGCGALGACKDSVSLQWRGFWAEDRPPIDTSIPVVIWAGGLDTDVSPAREHCVVDRITETVKGVVGNPVPLTVCTDQGSDHHTILQNGAPWVEQYLMHEYLAGPAVGTCPNLANLDPAPPMPAYTCGTPPPNSTNPADP